MSAGLASAENVRFLYDEMRQTLWKWRKGNTSARKAMLAQGLNPDLRDESGTNLLMFSASKCDLETIKELVERGASLKARTTGGDNVIMYGMFSLGTEWESPQCLPVRRYETVAFLLEKGADPNNMNRLGLFPLGLAVLAGRQDLVQLLLKHGADPQLRGLGKRNAIHLARRKGFNEIIKLFCKQDPDQEGCEDWKG